jgi:CrcB protein
LKAALLNSMLVGAGGFIGAICRYGVSGFVQRHAGLSAFPYGTLTVNLAGCFLIGIAVGLVDVRQMFGPEFRLFVLIGILGGFTTYSTFGYETFALLRDADFLRAFGNVIIHVVTGLVFVWLGYVLTSR